MGVFGESLPKARGDEDGEGREEDDEDGDRAWPTEFAPRRFQAVQRRTTARAQRVARGPAVSAGATRER